MNADWYRRSWYAPSTNLWMVPVLPPMRYRSMRAWRAVPAGLAAASSIARNAATVRALNTRGPRARCPGGRRCSVTGSSTPSVANTV